MLIDTYLTSVSTLWQFWIFALHQSKSWRCSTVFIKNLIEDVANSKCPLLIIAKLQLVLEQQVFGIGIWNYIFFVVIQDHFSQIHYVRISITSRTNTISGRDPHRIDQSFWLFFRIYHKCVILVVIQDHISQKHHLGRDAVSHPINTPYWLLSRTAFHNYIISDCDPGSHLRDW